MASRLWLTLTSPFVRRRTKLVTIRWMATSTPRTLTSTFASATTVKHIQHSMTYPRARPSLPAHVPSRNGGDLEHGFSCAARSHYRQRTALAIRLVTNARPGEEHR